MVTSCPRCGQGDVESYRVNHTGEQVRVCDECDALWPDEAAISPTEFEDLTDYMRRRGRTGAWSELVRSTRHERTHLPR